MRNELVNSRCDCFRFVSTGSKIFAVLGVVGSIKTKQGTVVYYMKQSVYKFAVRVVTQMIFPSMSILEWLLHGGGGESDGEGGCIKELNWDVTEGEPSVGRDWKKEGEAMM